MTKTNYQTPEIKLLQLEQEGIICGSDTANVGTGASWGTEGAGSDEGFIL